MKILEVSLKNFRNVPDTEVQLNGQNIILVGDNEVGKSNFLRAILTALGYTPGKGAIRTGENQAEVKLLLSEFKNGTPIEGTSFKFRARIKKSEAGEENLVLEVTDPKGFTERKKTIIGTVVGEIELDYNFAELCKTAEGKREQIRIIKSMLSTEDRDSINTLENKIQTSYDSRTDVNREVKAMEAYLSKSSIGSVPEEELKRYDNPIDYSALNEQIKEVVEHNNKRKRGASVIENNNVTIENNEKLITEYQDSLDKLVKEYNEKIKKCRDDTVEKVRRTEEVKKWLNENPTIDIASIEEEIKIAEEHNRKHELVKSFSQQRLNLKNLNEKSLTLSEQIDADRLALRAKYAEVKLPVAGLTLDQDHLYYKGKTVDPDNLSTSEIMMLEAKLKIANKANAKVLFVSRGESFGMKRLNELKEEAKKEGYQIIMEKVTDSEELRIEFMPK